MGVIKVNNRVSMTRYAWLLVLLLALPMSGSHLVPWDYTKGDAVSYSKSYANYIYRKAGAKGLDKDLRASIQGTAQVAYFDGYQDGLNAQRMSGQQAQGPVEMKFFSEKACRWASDAAKLAFTQDGDAFSIETTNRSAFSWVLTDCINPPLCTVTDEDRAQGIACLTLPPKCKVVVLDWCLDHGETRVIKKESK